MKPAQLTVWTPEVRAKAEASLLKWHGTPHHNRIAIPGVGVDCIQFVYEVLVDAGIIDRCHFSGYDLTAGMGSVSHSLKQMVKRSIHVIEVPKPAEFGDIAIFKTGRRSAHVAFYAGGDDLWHSLGHRQVIKSPFGQWSREIDCGLRITAPGFLVRPDKVLIEQQNL